MIVVHTYMLILFVNMEIYKANSDYYIHYRPEIDSNMKNKQISNSWSVGINSTQKDMLDDDAQ